MRERVLRREQVLDAPLERAFEFFSPYALWHHTHSFEAIDENRTLIDLVRYGQRLGPPGTAAEHLLVRRDIDRIFDFRRDAIPGLLAKGGAG